MYYTANNKDMKFTKYVFFLFIALLASACSDDDNEPGGNDGGEKNERTDIQKWIEDTMRKEYYWYKDIPEASKLKYKDVKPEDFFMSLLSEKDGKDYKIDEKTTGHYFYSSIEDLSKDTRSSIQTDYSYGFEFTGVNYGDEVRALIQYVLPNTPASDANLKRGNWISKINNAPLTNSNYRSLYGSEECTLTIVEFDPTANKFINPKDVEVESACPVEDNPVFHYDIITSPVKNKKVGYLVYNHFTDGKDEKDKSYDNELRTISARLKGVDEFVLDLRYNNGGLLTSARLLCAILAPETALGKSFGYLKYNDKKSGTSPIEVTKTTLAPGGQNLNMEKIYVLVSSISASASEMVINSLRPHMGDKNVILIGEQTEGKNVGSNPYTSDDKLWKMHPITCQIYNSVDFTDYANGFSPDYEMNEAFKPRGDGYVDILEMLPLGDPEERLLNAAISLIDGKSITTRSSASSSNQAVYKKASIQSIDRRATNGVIINE